MNKLMIIGNLGADPELKYTQNGKAVCHLSVGVTERPRNGVKQDTQWFRVSVWNKTAEWAAEALRKGARVFVDGKLEFQKWKGNDGVERYTHNVQCWEINLLGQPRNQTAPAPQAQPVQPTPVAQPAPQPQTQQGSQWAGPQPAATPLGSGYTETDIPF